MPEFRYTRTDETNGISVIAPSTALSLFEKESTADA